MGQYNKFWVALAAVVVAGLMEFLSIEGTLIPVIVGALGVYAAPNRDEGSDTEEIPS